MNKIKNNDGASMVFVLAVMFLLLTLGISALVAASANTSAVLNKQINDQLHLYADSMQQSILYSLQTSNNTPANGGDQGVIIGNATTLGGQLLGSMYDEALPALQLDSFETSLTPALSSDTGSDVPDLSAITSVAISFTPSGNTSSAALAPLVSITLTYEEELELLDFDETITIRHPQTAAIQGTATVTVRVEHRDKTLLSVVTYDLSGGLLEDDGANANNMHIKNAGEWRFVSHEKIMQ